MPSIEAKQSPIQQENQEEKAFAQRWREESLLRHAPDDPSVWDSRVKESPSNYAPSGYSHEFLKRASIGTHDSVFDMGAGAGSLAIPCARAGHQVLACDFSAGMLQQLERNRKAERIPAEFLQTKLLSWEDDWQKKGVALKSFDVAFASRSLITQDLENALRNLTNVARRQVCVTAVNGVSPRSFSELIKDLGLTPIGHDDASFVEGIARELGLEPATSVITSHRTDVFVSPDEAFAKYEPMLALTTEHPTGRSLDDARDKLRSWIEEHLKPQDPSQYETPEQAEIGTLLVSDVPRTISWSFISWKSPDRLI